MRPGSRIARFRWLLITVVVLLLIVMIGCSEGSDTGNNGSSSNRNGNENANTITGSTANDGGADHMSDAAFNISQLDEPTDPFYKRSIANTGDPARLAAIMRKAEAGKSSTLGFIGGSITVGYLSSDLHTKSWAQLVRAWWEKTFPNAEFEYVNAGIGATGSLFGVHRVDEDLHTHQPDFVMVEFSVNDLGVTGAEETYESLLRKILQSDHHPAVMALGMMDNQGNTQNYHLTIAKNYKVPFISYREAVWGLIQDGDLQWPDISPDTVHPNDKGHALAADIIIHYLESVYAKMDAFPEPAYDLPAPTTNNGFEHSTIYTDQNSSPSSLGSWQSYSGRWGRGWTASSPGEPFVIDVNGGYITINFARTNVSGKGGKALISIDGGKPITLDADFTGGWGDYVESKTIMKSKETGSHQLSITFDGAEGSEFIISGLLIANY